MTDRKVPPPKTHDGRFETVDLLDRLPLSHDLIELGFSTGFWYSLNDKYNLLVDEYEEQVIPADILASVATDVRSLADQPGTTGRLQEEILAVTEFLLRAGNRQEPVWLIL